MKASLQADTSTVRAQILGDDVTYKLGAPGRHVVDNSLGVLAASHLLGADLALAALSLAELRAPVGRGQRMTIDVPGGSVLLIDESYNANPTSMRAALALLGHVPMQGLGRRIAVLGDMLELGPDGAKLHAALSDAVLENAVDLVYCAGPLMKSLWDALPSERRGGYAENSAALEAEVLKAITAGDAVMVKGSLGSRMGRIVKALQRRFRAGRTGAGLTHALLARGFLRHALGPQRLPLPDGAHRRRHVHGRACSCSCSVPGSSIICGCARARASRSARMGPESHLTTKRGTPTMGGLMILSGVTVSTVLWANPYNPYVWIVLGVTLCFGLVGFYDDYLKVTKQTHGGFAGTVAPGHRRRCGVGRLLGAGEPRPSALRDLARPFRSSRSWFSISAGSSSSSVPSSLSAPGTP